MGFGTDLQGKKSHEAFIRLQDAEIRFFENLKRCINVRIDSDKKYTSSLTSFVQQAQKIDLSGLQTQSSTYKAWETVTQQTSKFIEMLRTNHEELSSKTMDKINSLIIDKKAARKQYLDDRNKLEQDFTKVQDEVQRYKQEYSKSAERFKVDKAKYNDMQSKGKPSKIEDAKTKYIKSTGKLHRVHNDYVLSLREVVTHESSYLKQTLPTILDHHQNRHELMLDQCKDILQDLHRLTDFTNEDFCDLSKQIGESVSQISPDKDITNFIDEFRTDPLPVTPLEFDNMLLDDCDTSLTQDKIAVNDETVDSLNSRLSTVEAELSKFTKSLEEKESTLSETKTSLKKLQKYEEETKALNLEYVSNCKELEDLKREVTELRAKKDILQVLCDTIKTPVQAVGDSVPSATDLSNESVDDNSTSNTSTVSGGSVGGGGKMSALKGLRDKFTTGRKKQNQEKEDPQRANSYEESEVSSTSNGPRIHSTSDGHEDKSDLPLEEEAWFHGVLPREEVQRLLKEDGDFLVRESKNRRTNETQYVLSVFWQGHRHFIIQYGDGGWRFEGTAFRTISELVLNQHKSGLPVTTKSQAILSNPILREQWQLRNDDIALEMKIGNGNFGEVYKGVYKPRSMTVAVKTCKDTLSEDQRKKFLQEGRILKQYDHPNIVRFIGIAAQRQPVMIVMEFVQGGALLTFLRKQGKNQSKKTLTKMCEDAANGMAYLESKNCIHRDLAARNCLISDNNCVKISDFGMSREEEEYTVSDGLKQIPIKWTAPEALLYGKYTSLCDVWSFGILMWEVFSGGLTPYQGMSNAESREKVDSGYRMPASADTPDEVYALMLNCWERNPNKRPHFEKIYTTLESIASKL